MKVVILAGGLGTRLKPFTEVIPKPLLPIGEKSVLEIQIERLKKFGFDEIFLATNYKSQYIEGFFGDGSRYGVKLSISKEDKPLGTAGPLLLLKEQLTEPFIVMNGDILSLIDFSKLYEFATDTLRLNDECSEYLTDDGEQICGKISNSKAFVRQLINKAKISKKYFFVSNENEKYIINKPNISIYKNFLNSI